MKIRIDPLDKLFSQYIHLRDKTCQRCGGTKIAWAHFHGRAKKSVRWDEDNACALCFGCHIYLDSHPIEKIEFFQGRLRDRYDLLNARANQLGKPDKEAIELYLLEKIKLLGG